VKRRRNTSQRGDYSGSDWGQMLLNDHNEMTTDPMCPKANTFRRRFGVPYPVFFRIIVPICKAKKVFFNTNGKFAIPVEIKVLIALRILGRDACADDCVEFSNVAEKSCNSISHQFVDDSLSSK
jgi:hypothetical protein